MADTTDQLSTQKSRYLAEIRQLEERIARLRTKVEVIDEIRRDSQQPVPHIVSLNGEQHGKRTGLTKFALAAVKGLGAAPIGNIAAAVTAMGYQPKKNFKTSLATTLERLDGKKLKIEEKDGVKIYRSI